MMSGAMVISGIKTKPRLEILSKVGRNESSVANTTRAGLCERKQNKYGLCDMMVKNRDSRVKERNKKKMIKNDSEKAGKKTVSSWEETKIS